LGRLAEYPSSMATRVENDQKTARNKGLLAGATAAGAALLLLASPVVGAIGLGGAAYLTYDWFKFRAKRGMRF
jgi:hypothetical protein